MNYSALIARVAQAKSLLAPLPGMDSLAHWDYADEVSVKQAALRELLNRDVPLLAAVQPRKYRSTTKRRVRFRPGRIELTSGDQQRPGFAETVAFSELEPEVHRKLYAWMIDWLLRPASEIVAKELNWIILRGAQNNPHMVLNVAKINAGIVRRLKQLCEEWERVKAPVGGASMFIDPTRSDYYLEAERPTQGLDHKHLMGSRLLEVTIGTVDNGGFKLKYPPTVFSQINEPMIPAMLDLARGMMQLSPGDRLLDLYCGYGLFGFGLCLPIRDVRCTGVEYAGASVDAAKENARYLDKAGRFRFLSGRLTGEWLVANEAAMFAPGGRRMVLLDPPRQGPAEGVIEGIAAFQPDQILHIFCGTDEIIPGINAWARQGYVPQQIQALDLFPGTANVETFVLLHRS